MKVGAMDAFIFVYTLCIILICFAAATLSLSAWLVTRRKVLLVQIGFFVAYILEIGDIFSFEWTSQNTHFVSSEYYEISDPILRTLTGAIILFCLWVMLLNLMDIHSRKVAVTPVVAFAAACAVVVAFLPYGPLRQFCYYSLRQVFIISCLIYVFIHWYRSDDQTYRERLKRYRVQYFLLWAFTLLIVLEDWYVILYAPIPGRGTSLAPLYLSERNFSENALMIFIAYYTSKDALQSLSLRFRKPPESSEETQDDLSRHIDEALPIYASKYDLSPREQEVLALVIAGDTNRSIADKLILSEGTIKTHVHNIMKKTGCSTRKELKMHFWSK